MVVFNRVWAQFRLMFRKDTLVFWRKWRLTLLQLTSPFFFVLIIFMIDVGFNASPSFRERKKVVKDYDIHDFYEIPRCMPSPCNTIIYAPSNTVTDALVEKVRVWNDIPSDEVRGFATLDVLDQWVFDNQNKSQAGYIFDNTTFTVPTDISFTIMYNTSIVCRRRFDCNNPVGGIVAPMEYFMTKAIFLEVDPVNFDYTVELVKMPRKELEDFDVVGGFGQFFFFLALMFHFIVFSALIVQEKEFKLRLSLNIMGLNSLSYWMSWFLTAFVITFVSILVLIASGAAFQFEFFLENNFFLYFILFVLSGFGIVTMGFTLSAFMQYTKTCTPFGFAFFIVFYIGNILAVNIVYNPDITTYDWLQVLLMFLPPVVLAKGLDDLSKESSGEDKHGISWAHRNSYTDLYPLPTLFIYSAIDILLYTVLLWYFDNVIAGEFGTGEPFYFCFLPSYWTGKRRHSEGKTKERSGIEKVEGCNIDEDVAREAHEMESLPAHRKLDVRLMHLRKEFPYSSLPWKKDGFVAVKDVSFGIDQGQLVCLLGPNGAGKTTTFNMLTGVFPPTSGHAETLGLSIFSQMDQIRKKIGVCPQHDVLWGELTSREHLELFAGLKGLPQEDIPDEVDKRLEQVNLMDVKNVVSSAYSGGMRRRLSVAIALIGDPRVVYLDEPTTGMDPIARRQVWDMIEEAKKGRSILLTTHSMEEADMLGDRIVIMALGLVRCVGSSLRLKNKFGTGYRISFSLPRIDAKDRLDAFVRQHLPEAKMVSSVKQFVAFQVPRSMKPLMPNFFLAMEHDPFMMTIEYSLGLATLEEVFIRISEQSREDDAKETAEEAGEESG